MSCCREQPLNLTYHSNREVMAYTVPSSYQPIWDTLKEKHQARLVAPMALHTRIFDAVRKRKNLDLAYKLQCSDQFKSARLVRSTDPEHPNILILELKFFYHLHTTGAY